MFRKQSGVNALPVCQKPLQNCSFDQCRRYRSVEMLTYKLICCDSNLPLALTFPDASGLVFQQASATS